MSDPTTAKKSICQCPHCGKRVAVDAVHLGRKANCPQCQKAFMLVATEQPAGAAAASPGAPAAGTSSSDSPICAVCQSAVAGGEPSIRCSGCSAVYHQDCWDYNKGCAAYGCSEAPPTEKLNTLEIPASYWGQEDKACPSCGKTILAAAVRCKHCGATFASIRPQDTREFQAESGIAANLPKTKKVISWFLVFSIIPFTSPFAAVFGWIWWAKNAAAVRKLPALNRALCKIALGISVVQTAFLLLAAVGHKIAG